MERERELSAGDHVHDGASLGCRDHGRFWRPLALPLRQRGPGLRGIHVDAVRVPNPAAHDGSAVTTPPSFPTLAGLGWSVHKKPVFSTIVASHASGREVRDPLYQNPIWQFELTFDALSSSPTSYPGAGANSLQALMGFFLQMQGQFGTFLYDDPTDSTATNVGFATGDGGTSTFTFCRFMGAFLEPVGWVM